MSPNLIFFIALAPLLWAIINHVDKYLIVKYFHGGGIGGLMIFSTLFSIFTLPVIIFFDKTAFLVTIPEATLLTIAGLCNALSVWLYLLALNQDETSIVVPFMQMRPILFFIMGYFFLGETLTLPQIIGGITIIAGVTLLTIDIDVDSHQRFRWKVFAFMVLHSVIYTVYGILFKFVSLKEGFWSGAFWESIGLIIFGIILASVPRYRKEFLQVFRKNSGVILVVNLASEVLTIAGNWITTFGLLLAPVALVSLIAGYQPLFVLIIGVLVTLYLPHLGEENLTKRAMVQKGLAVAIVIFGTYLLY